MSNMLMMRYAATRGNDPEYNEPENRYRGKDGRWRAGTRSEYEERPHMGEYDSRTPRMGDYDGGWHEPPRNDEDEKGRKYKIEVLPNSNTYEWPQNNDYRTSRQIGFGARNNMDDAHHSEPHMMGHSGMDEGREFDRETAEHWVRSMRNEDKSHPTGGKWTPDMLKPMAQKYGIPTDGKRFWELYAMTNAMYSDYSEVAKKFGVVSPEFYVCLAKAWMEDEDAEPDKTELYYEYIVKK